MFKVNNKDIRTTSLAAEGKCWLGRILQKCYSSSIFSFNVSVFPLVPCPLSFWVSFSLYKTIFSMATHFINALPSNRNNDRVAFSKTAPEVWCLWILHFLKERNNSFKRTYHILGCLLDPTLGYGWIVKMEVIWYATFYSNH